MQLLDTHCHLDFPDFDKDRDIVIERAKKAHVSSIINVGSSLNGSKKSLDLSKKYSIVYASVGIHPHYADKVGDRDFELIESWVSFEKVKAIGEVGLDYYRNLSSHSRQEEVFERFILLSKKFNLPLIIHCRQAEEDVFKILARFSLKSGGVMHCFSGDKSFLKKCLDLGLFISFTSNLTYKKSDNLREVLKSVPLERLMLETDAPFLAPQDMRGRRNEPAYLTYLLSEVASTLGVDEEKIANQTTANAKRFFNLI